MMSLSTSTVSVPNTSDKTFLRHGGVLIAGATGPIEIDTINRGYCLMQESSLSRSNLTDTSPRVVVRIQTAGEQGF